MKWVKIAGIVALLLVLAFAAFWATRPYRHLPIEDRPRPTHDSLGRMVWPPDYPDVMYATTSRFEKMDIYLPHKRSRSAPVVIWIHGGGLTVGDKRSMPRIDLGPAPKPAGKYGPYQVQVPDVALLTEHGYAVVSLNYELGFSLFTAVVPAVKDVKAAVRFIRSNASRYSLDGERIAVWGNSMGGYLAAMAGATGDQRTGFDDADRGNATTSSAVQAVVVWFGAEDRFPQPLTIAHYLPSAKILPPFRIVNGDADPVVSPAQATRLHQALLQARAKSTLEILTGAGHEDPQYSDTQMVPTLAFLDAALRG